MARRLNVGLIGYYGRGNFGDDLVAALIGSHLVQRGHRCSVLGFDETMAAGLGLSGAGDPVLLAEASDVIVVGGGSLLSRRRLSHLHRSLRLHEGAARRTTAHVLDRAARRGIPRLAISIGSDTAHLRQLSGRQVSLIRTLTGATVRNREAAELFENAGRSAVCFPDVALQASRLFPVPPREAGARRFTVGIDVYWSNLLRRGAFYLPALIGRMVRRRGDVSFLFIDSTHRDSAPFRAMGPPPGAPNAERYQFHDLRTDLARLAAMDLLLSTRLHTGVAAVSYGVPFVSLFGEAKTTLFLRDAGLAQRGVAHRNALPCARQLLRRGGLEEWAWATVPPAVQEAIDGSAGHLAALDEMLAAIV